MGSAQAAQIARLMEQTVALQRQIDRLEIAIHDSKADVTALTDAKFVTQSALIEGQSQQVAVALAERDKADAKEETATEKRFDSVNEFRQQLNDQAATFMPRSEHAVEMKGLQEGMTRQDEIIKTLQIWQGNITGRVAVYGTVFTVFMTLIIFAANYLTKSS